MSDTLPTLHLHGNLVDLRYAIAPRVTIRVRPAWPKATLGLLAKVNPIQLSPPNPSGALRGGLSQHCLRG
ncbi:MULTISPECIES: hypothetical protein [Moorena]|uniref:hypothetical protein n=1 Tax=Moorena TaxID=1155738 RepID=UPI00105576AD|nr:MULTISPECIES: hypothetical protein [Moorena]NEQ14984.1 hypothetical protein [Moorena sp. SIO3E2]NES86211.1 hypothetical protein [Moorena sp. SIO2B7]NEP36533.1 hypothetical protein [Moorena sp. SIO3B2]NEP67533.1 hypothetical protein [Moorena sp. SIO3A5]NEQ06706.1 hypothetical protein [Moorena sp. SIO4E2]